MSEQHADGTHQCDDCKAPLEDHEQGFCPHEIETGEMVMYSRLTDTYYRVTKWVEQGDGKFIALQKQPKTQSQDTGSDHHSDGDERVEQSQSGTDRPDPTEHPESCSKCGVHIGSFGGDYCDPCAREIRAKPPMQRCRSCGKHVPRDRMDDAIDVSPDDEYYPTIRYLCRGCAGGGGESA